MVISKKGVGAGAAAPALTSPGDRTANLWSLETGASTSTSGGHCDGYNSEVFSGDGASVYNTYTHMTQQKKRNENISIGNFMKEVASRRSVWGNGRGFV